MASKRQNAPSEEADSCQVRSNALGAFERTHGRTQEQGTNACPAGPSGYLRSNARDCGRTQVQSARISHVALAGPIVHRFNLAPWAVMCVRTHLRSNPAPTHERTQRGDAFVVVRAPEDRTHAAVRSNATPCVRTHP
jgi:hypothetical protein